MDFKQIEKEFAWSNALLFSGMMNRLKRLSIVSEENARYANKLEAVGLLSKQWENKTRFEIEAAFKEFSEKIFEFAVIHHKTEAVKIANRIRPMIEQMPLEGPVTDFLAIVKPIEAK